VNAPAIFQNGEFQLRVTAAGDSFRVEAPGLAKALGFHSARDMVRSIPEAEKGWELSPTLGGDQETWFVTEPGFYRALGQRQVARIKDTAVRDQVTRFQTWVYGDILPQIRRTGGYAAPTPAPSGAIATMSPRDLALLVLQEADRADLAEQRAAALEPAARAWEVLGAGSGNYSFREAAGILNQDPVIRTGQNRLFDFVRGEGMLDDRGRPYSKFSQYIVQRPLSYVHPRTGEPVATTQLRLTPEGVGYLHRRLGGIRDIRELATAGARL
jgi:anti-repressor protein